VQFVPRAVPPRNASAADSHARIDLHQRALMTDPVDEDARSFGRPPVREYSQGAAPMVRERFSRTTLWLMATPSRSRAFSQ